MRSVVRLLAGRQGIIHRRYAGDCASGTMKKGLVLGVYDGCSVGEYKPTATFARYDEKTGGKLMSLIKGMKIGHGDVQVFSNVGTEFTSIAVTNLGPEGLGYNEVERLDECKEAIRTAAAVGARALQDEGLTQIYVEGFTNPEPAAEGAILAVWRYQELKDKADRYPEVRVELFENDDMDGWMRGKVKAENQNLARKIEETPANLMTPYIFGQIAVDSLCPCGIAVDVRDKDWIESMKMSAFLQVARGSCEPPVFVEMSYCGLGGPNPIVLTGKGITFDSGGLCLKECRGMSEYRGDLAGAAVIVGVMKTIAMMALPIDVIALIPLAESMIGGMAAHPGDIVRARNGKSIMIEDTDNEGRVILADTLSYSQSFHPCLVMNIATLTPGIRKALGTSSSGTWTNANVVWRELERAGSETGDRLWRMPLWKYYKQRVTDYRGVDLNNVGKARGGGPNLGAAFLKEFLHEVDLAHVDITGTGLLSNGIGHPYLRKGVMTGRPTRTLVQFLYQIACPHVKGDEC
uniref:Cytosol aminopeptidase n=1 Tax=Lygus hesperus TaxID=30085 RepID=A0A0A9YBR0_LYGHE